MKKIGILGSGYVGQALAVGFLTYGYEVMIASNHPEKLADFKKSQPKVKLGDFTEAAAFGEVLVLCCKGTAVSEVLKLSGVDNLKGKVILDTTNPLADLPPQNGILEYFTNFDESLIERSQKEFPNARFVKAFNSVGSGLMVNPDFGGIRPSMFICGNDQDAKTVARGIIEQFGWEVEDMGLVQAGRAIEPLCMLWCIPGFQHNEWTHAFKLLKK